jgi:hypothetical protein
MIAIGQDVFGLVVDSFGVEGDSSDKELMMKSVSV